MHAIYFDSKVSDDVRRSRLYEGHIYVYSPPAALQKLCQLARDMIEDAFKGADPLRIHETVPVEKCVEILTALKPQFIHHPKSKEHIRELLIELGCDPELTYFDVPRLRTAFAGEYLKSGIAYAFHPHRDTWYSAPPCQINWWTPVYDVSQDNCMAFHPWYFDRPIRNSSRVYNYQEWNRVNRFSASQHVTKDTRVQPHAEEPVELEPDMRFLTGIGGLTMFSAAQLHSTVPNTSGVTRYSIDFRTVHLGDVQARRGAPNVDAACTGTTLGDYLQGRNLSHIPPETIALHEAGTPIAQAAPVVALASGGRS
jgi:hypothetical protein